MCITVAELGPVPHPDEVSWSLLFYMFCLLQEQKGMGPDKEINIKAASFKFS